MTFATPRSFWVCRPIVIHTHESIHRNKSVRLMMIATWFAWNLNFSCFRLSFSCIFHKRCAHRMCDSFSEVEVRHYFLRLVWFLRPPIKIKPMLTFNENKKKEKDLRPHLESEENPGDCTTSPHSEFHFILSFRLTIWEIDHECV